MSGLVGLRHVALWVADDRFVATVRFYREAFDMQVQWQPDDDNVYLSSGTDNLALHRAVAPRQVDHASSALDHLGFFVASPADVQVWHDRVAGQCAALGATIAQPPRTHRDGATSFYVRDPAGHLVQVLHVP